MLHYKIIGSGKAVVFLHGFLESSSMWEIFRLEDFDFKSVLIDLPGHGNSLLEKKYHSLAEIAQEIHELLAELNIKNYDIIGHSLGGYVAIELLKLCSSSSKLCLFHSNFWEDEDEKKINRNRVIDAVKKNKNFFIHEAIPNLFLEKYRASDFVNNLIEEAKSIKGESIILYSELMRDRSSNESFILNNSHRINIIQGKFDQIVSLEKMEKFDKRLNISYSEAGHMGHFEAKEQEISMIKAFF